MTEDLRARTLESFGLLPLVRCLDLRPESIHREAAVIAYHFHWSRAECLGMSRRERAVWLEEIKHINQEISRAMKGGRK